MNSIVLEMSLIASSLELAAKHLVATKPALKPIFWDRLAPDLVNCLPGDLVKALYLQFHELDQANFGYRKLMQGDVDNDTGQAIGFTLFCWAYNAAELQKLIVAWGKKRPWQPTWWQSRLGRLRQDKWNETLGLIKDGAVSRLRAAGFDVDDDGNLRTGPVKTRWEPQ